MRLRTLIVAGMLVASTGTAFAATGSGAPSRAAAAIRTVRAGDAASAHTPAYTKADLRSPATWRAARERVLRERIASMPRATAGTIVMVSFLFDDALPIADVDRDGTHDVLSVRLQGRTPSIDVLSGRTGRVLWSHADPTAYAAIYIEAPGGTPIVLTLSDTQTGADAVVGAAGEDVFTVTALRADHGTQLWSTSITGLVESDVAEFNVVGAGEFDGVLTRTGTTPYLLLDRQSFGENFFGGASSIAPEVINAATGAVVSAGQPVPGDSFAYASPVNDLSGDGIDDYVVASAGDAAAIEAVSSANGEPLWAKSLASPGTFVWVNFVGSSPDLSGDRKPDVLLGESGDSGDTVSALAGATGTTVWTHAGSFASPLGDIDHDGRSDTRVVSFGVRLTYAAVSASGRTLWSRDVLTPAGPVVGVSYPVGDLNGDGAVDTYVRFVSKTAITGPAADSSTGAIAAYIVDGRTGRARATHDLGLPSGDSLSGRAMTFVQTLQAKHGVRVTAFDGASGRAYWRSSLSLSDATGAIDVSVLPLSNGRRGIVEILGGRATETVVVLDGKRGARQWVSSYATLGTVGIIID